MYSNTIQCTSDIDTLFLLYAGAHLGAIITIWIFTFSIEEYTTWSKGIMQYSLEMHEK